MKLKLNKEQLEAYNKIDSIEEKFQKEQSEDMIITIKEEMVLPHPYIEGKNVILMEGDRVKVLKEEEGLPDVITPQSTQEENKEEVVSELTEAEVDINKLIKDMQGNFGGDNESQMKGIQILKGLATSSNPKANEYMQKLDKATTEISKEVLQEKQIKQNFLKNNKIVEKEKKASIDSVVNFLPGYQGKNFESGEPTYKRCNICNDLFVVGDNPHPTLYADNKDIYLEHISGRTAYPVHTRCFEKIKKFFK